MTITLTFAGTEFILHHAGALYWPANDTLVVSDLHLEKGSAAARRGQLVPPWDSTATLARLAALSAQYAPARVIALGDSFHDNGGPMRLAPQDRAALAALTAATDFIWVHGNHDPAPPAGIGGTATPEFHEAGLIFRHQAQRAASAEISGHFHPKARIPTRAGGVTRACFITDGAKLILPAFGAYTGGLDVSAPAIAGHFPRGATVHLLGDARLFSFTVRRDAA